MNKIVKSCCAKSHGRYLLDQLYFQPQKRAISYQRDGSFVQKSTKDLLVAATLFKLCSYNPIIDHGETLLKTSRMVLGQSATNAILRRTFYRQFCIGDTEDELVRKSAEMREWNIYPMLAITAEEESNPDAFQSGESWFEENKERMLMILSLTNKMYKTSFLRPTHMKLTAILDAEICAKLSKLITDGEGYHIDNWLQSLSRNNDVKSVEIPSLSNSDMEHLKNAFRRFHEIAAHASNMSCSILIDAEYCSINPMLNYIALYGMKLYNKKSPVVQYTYQCYLKDSYETAMKDIQFCMSKNLQFGSKFVRGAYMNKERKIALEQNKESPIFETWAQTNDNYDRLMAKVLRIVGNTPNNYQIAVATHNERSVERATERMQRYGIAKTSGQVYFAQLYGLSDHLSCWLADNGFLVYKSSPIGSEEETVPYMIRRAQENSSVIAGSRRDRDIVKAEVSRRMRQRIWPNS